MYNIVKTEHGLVQIVHKIETECKNVIVSVTVYNITYTCLSIKYKSKLLLKIRIAVNKDQ